ncbi:ZW10 interactor isoform X3 [Falco rusticolus]|uniref:ZW10 interactor isoform X3 n=1 Tax=Falco rusticolus TaxID=120794 RepID=UPI0018869F90|nr:ZW10 interactor isoform X3 [Falco rusticolus]
MHPFPVPPVRPLSPPLPKWWRAAPSEGGGGGACLHTRSLAGQPVSEGGAARRLVEEGGGRSEKRWQEIGCGSGDGRRLVEEGGGRGEKRWRAIGGPRWQRGRKQRWWRRAGCGARGGFLRTLAALEAALALEEENSDIPARVLVEHLVDTRRKQKLLLTQLRVLCQLLGVIESPGPHLAPLAPCEAGALAQARERWRELKAECEEVLGGALPSALTRLRKGQCLLQRLQGALEARLQQKEELEAELREALERREQLRGRVAEQRQERLSRQEALRHCQEAALRAEASCRLYRMLTGGAGGCPPPRGAPVMERPPPAHHLHHSPQGAPLPAAPPSD